MEVVNCYRSAICTKRCILFEKNNILFTGDTCSYSTPLNALLRFCTLYNYSCSGLLSTNTRLVSDTEYTQKVPETLSNTPSFCYITILYIMYCYFESQSPFKFGFVLFCRGQCLLIRTQNKLALTGWVGRCPYTFWAGIILYCSCTRYQCYCCSNAHTCGCHLSHIIRLWLTLQGNCV